MIYVKINNILYATTVSGRVADEEWDNRSSKSITLEMSHAEAANLFVDGIEWSIVVQEETPVLDDNGVEVDIATKEIEFDNSEYNIAGDITDHRDGTITVKMGKLTDLEEAYEIMLGGI